MADNYLYQRHLMLTIYHLILKATLASYKSRRNRPHMEVSEIQPRLYKTKTMNCYQIYHQHTDSHIIALHSPVINITG